jgi:hypothetical protein
VPAKVPLYNFLGSLAIATTIKQLGVILVSDTNQLKNISVDLSVDHNLMVLIV